jgi:hypothetical protein
MADFLANGFQIRRNGHRSIDVGGGIIGFA